MSDQNQTEADVALTRAQTRVYNAQAAALEADNRSLQQYDIARVCHEANRAYCAALGDDSQVAWEEAPEWQRDSAVDGVAHIIANPKADAAASHVGWMAQKEADGWTYGETKSEDLRTHPCIVPFSELPREQQAKDYIFGAIVRALT